MFARRPGTAGLGFSGRHNAIHVAGTAAAMLAKMCDRGMTAHEAAARMEIASSAWLLGKIPEVGQAMMKRICNRMLAKIASMAKGAISKNPVTICIDKHMMPGYDRGSCGSRDRHPGAAADPGIGIPGQLRIPGSVRDGRASGGRSPGIAFTTPPDQIPRHGTLYAPPGRADQSKVLPVWRPDAAPKGPTPQRAPYLLAFKTVNSGPPALARVLARFYVWMAISLAASAAGFAILLG